MNWISWTNFVLGLWLIIAPFTLGYAGVTTAVYEDVILGILIALFAAIVVATRLVSLASVVIVRPTGEPAAATRAMDCSAAA